MFEKIYEIYERSILIRIFDNKVICMCVRMCVHQYIYIFVVYLFIS